jgi:glutathione S-transferase
VIRLLGRQTSGNVQKVIFCLEELGLPYVREDYGRQFGNTLTEAYRKLNPTAKVPTLIDGELVIWESHTILRYLAAVHGPTLTGATPAERTMVERWMDWLLGALNTPYVAVFRDAKKVPAERAPDFAAQSADLLAQAQNTGWPHRRARLVRAQSLHHRRHCARLDREALPGVSDRAPGLFGARALADCDRCTAGLCGGNRCQAERANVGGMRRRRAEWRQNSCDAAVIVAWRWSRRDDRLPPLIWTRAYDGEQSPLCGGNLWERQWVFHKVLIARGELRSSGDTPAAARLLEVQISPHAAAIARSGGVAFDVFRARDSVTPDSVAANLRRRSSNMSRIWSAV